MKNSVIGSNNKRNVGFDFLKFVFAILIVTLHLYIKNSFYTCVEGFFAITGIYIYIGVDKKPQNTFTFVFKKYLNLLPHLVICGLFYFIVSLVNLSIHNTLSTSWQNAISQLFYFIIPLHINSSSYVIWFVSSLIVACLLLYPLCKFFKKNFPIVALFMSFIIYSITFVVCGNIDVWGSKFFDLFYWGYLRGIGGICVGIFIGWLSKIIKSYFLFKKTTLINILSLIAIFLLLGVYCYFGYVCWKTKFDFLLIYLLFLVIFIINSSPIFNQLNFKPSKHLAGISFTLYLTHPSLIMLLNNFNINRTVYVVIVYVCSLGMATLFYFISSTLYETLKKRRKIKIDNDVCKM